LSLRDHHRFEYSPITRRADFDWPGGKRLAVYIALNLEHFVFGEGLGGRIGTGSASRRFAQL
jgi:allantoinase